MAYTWTIFVALLCVNSVLCKICDFKDSDCLVRWANTLYPTFIVGAGIVKSSDPLYKDMIEANLPIFKYILKNAEFIGMKNCTVTTLEYNEDNEKFKYFLRCPRMILKADHVAKGDIAGFNIDVKGKITITGDDYMYHLSGTTESTIDADGKKHIQIKEHDIYAKANGNLVMDFQNDYDASTSDFPTVQKFLSENWMDMDEHFRKPTIDSFMDLFVDNINDYLRLVPFQPFVSDD